MRFLGYIVSHQDIQIEEKQIKAIHDWPELQSVYDIQVFLGFANFYNDLSKNSVSWLPHSLPC